MALAKYHADRGNRLLAFYILKNARRGVFEPHVFAAAFTSVFRPELVVDSSDDRISFLLNEVDTSPQSIKALTALAKAYVAREDWPRAVEYLERAVKRDPDNPELVGELALTHSKNNDVQTARRLLADFVRQYPDSVAAHQDRFDQHYGRDSAAAKRAITEGLAKWPNDPQLTFNLGVILQEENDLAGAERAFRKAAQLAPGEAQVQAQLARFLLKAKKDPAAALPFYLNAYFLDPDARETEFVESRIRSINYEMARKVVEQHLRKGGNPSDLLADSNPVVVDMAIDAIEQNWQSSAIEHLLTAMEHDDGVVRWHATTVLMKHLDRSFDPELHKLLVDPDQRKRGLSGYLAVKLWGDDGVKAVAPWLQSDVQLLRFDAISSLVLHGGELGKRTIEAHRDQESNDLLRRMMLPPDQ